MLQAAFTRPHNARLTSSRTGAACSGTGDTDTTCTDTTCTAATSRVAATSGRSSAKPRAVAAVHQHVDTG